MGWIIFSFAQWTWSVATLPVVIYFIHNVIGLPAALAGCGVIFLGQWVMRRLAEVTKIIVTELQEARDVRSRLITEYVKTVRLVKLQSLDHVWVDRLEAAREAELVQLKKMRYWNAFNSFVGQLMNFLLPVTIFSVYVLQGEDLTGTVVFTTLAWIQQMSWTLSSLPGAFNMYFELSPSLLRLSTFLNEARTLEDSNEADNSAYSISVGDRGSGSNVVLGNDFELGEAVVSAVAPTPAEARDSRMEPLLNTNSGKMNGPRVPSLISSDRDSNNSNPSSPSHSYFQQWATESTGEDQAEKFNISKDHESMPSHDSMKSAHDDRLMKWYRERVSDSELSTKRMMSPRTSVRVQRAQTHEPVLICESLICGYLRGGTTDNSDSAIGPGFTLEANFTVVGGQLVVFCGAVGSGKSTLLACLSHARPPISGRVQIPELHSQGDINERYHLGADGDSTRPKSGSGENDGRACVTVPNDAFTTAPASRALVTQKPFILNGTIRENITFHAPYDEARYLDTLQKCCLLQDLEAFPDHDQTLVGEAGVQLSGGQKARVGLARALYSDADLLFLDDVLSAVDAHTGRYIFDNVICAQAEQGRTVFLVTHQLQYLSRSEVSEIFLLEDGKVQNTSWETIKTTGVPDFCLSSDESERDDQATSKDDPTADMADDSRKKLQKKRKAQEPAKKEADDAAANAEYMKRLRTMQLAANARSHSVLLNECTDAVTSILRTMTGQRVSDAMIAQVTSIGLLL